MKKNVLICTFLFATIIYSSAQDVKLFKKQKKTVETQFANERRMNGVNFITEDLIASNSVKKKSAAEASSAVSESNITEPVTKALPTLTLSPDLVAPIENVDVPALSESGKIRTETYYVKKERGVALWLDNDRAENLRNNFALHKTAPIGSVIKVVNPMNNRAIYVKVVGRLQNDIAHEQVMILLSKGAARQLNVYDEKFVAELMIPKR